MGSQSSLFGGEAPEKAPVKEAGELPKVLISRCLLGIPCRFHGKATTPYGTTCGRPALVAKLRERFVLVDICPEVDAGLPTPRPAVMRRDGKWMDAAGNDVTAAYLEGARLAIVAARENGCVEAWLLKKSPACGKDYGEAAGALEKAGVKIHAV